MDILRRIERTARLHGDRIAMRSRSGEITYNDLWMRSGKLANHLEQSLSSSMPIMIYGHKSPEMLTCFLACIRSGHPYCPVDICMPKERIQDIADTIGTEIVLAPDVDQPELIGNYHVLDSRQIDQAIRWNHTISPSSCNREDDVHYIIFTSGSSGKPKGVQITTRCLENYLNWSRHLGTPAPHTEEIPDGTVFLNQAPFSFDLSVMDLYNALTTGGTLVALDKELQQDSPAMLGYLAANHIEYWISTPSFADLCLADNRFNAESLPHLRAFLFCGETLGTKTARSLLQRFPQAHVINTYGPTESTVCMTSVEITPAMASHDSPLPVGLTKPGTIVHLDDNTGEIIILGDTVSPGYYKDAEKTRAAFFYTELDGTPYHGYRTGDKGHWDENGMLYCDGRLDHQIKLHGYRIELGDIESNLTALQGIAQAAVLPNRRDGIIDSLTAYVMLDPDSPITDDYQGRKHVRQALRDKLPAYMVPKRVRFIEHMPLTTNGKVDRRQLERIG